MHESLTALLCAIVCISLAGCSLARRPPKSRATAIPSGSNVPRPRQTWSAIPDAVPRAEPRGRRGNPPFYEVFGKRYYVMAESDGWVERGTASWYGPGFHAASTSLGERYDMYAMTAAHKTLPIPCYAEVTNLRNGRKVVVRINDRGPFVGDRIIDLSYTAAAKLDMLLAGTAPVEVRVLTPGPRWRPARRCLRTTPGRHPPLPLSAAVHRASMLRRRNVLRRGTHVHPGRGFLRPRECAAPRGIAARFRASSWRASMKSRSHARCIACASARSPASRSSIST